MGVAKMDASKKGKLSWRLDDASDDEKADANRMKIAAQNAAQVVEC
jgi:hypothetical protein